VQPEPVARIDPREAIGSRRSSRCSPCAPLSASRLRRPRSYTPAWSWRSSLAPHWPLTVTGCERSCAHSAGSEHLRAPDLSAQDVPLSVVGGRALNRRSERVRGRVASTVRWPRSERSVLAGSTSAPAHRSGGAHSSKRRAREQRCRRLRATPLDSVGEPSGAAPYSGGSPGLFSGGVYGTPPRGHPWLPGAFPQGVGLTRSGQAVCR
jgi:hypothetical protein